MKHEKLTIYSDGGARGNPGPAGIGCVIFDEAGKTASEISECIGQATNNQAEYQALLAALKRAHELGASEVDCMMDSELAVRQLNHEYKVRNRELAPLFVKVWNETIHFKAVRFQHIPRERNKLADSMDNEAIDQALPTGRQALR